MKLLIGDGKHDRTWLHYSKYWGYTTTKLKRAARHKVRQNIRSGKYNDLPTTISIPYIY